MADMRYYGNVMTTTRWRLYVILHLQQYSRRLNLLYFFCARFRFHATWKFTPLLELHCSFRFNAIWHRRSTAVLMFCMMLAESDVTHAISHMYGLITW